MSEYTHLLHPEYFETIPFIGHTMAANIDRLATREEEMALCNGEYNITVAIRALNEAVLLEKLLKDVHGQRFAGEVEVVVVDNESNDNTVEVAKTYGAEVVNLPRADFTYARSMNAAMDAASYDYVFMTVAHAELSNDQLLHGAARYLSTPEYHIAGAYSRTLPGANASRTENLASIGLGSFGHSREVVKSGFGVMGATNAAVKKSSWREAGGFDERYQSGGEDSALAARLLDKGLRIIEDPILAVHHSRGRGPINFVRRLRHFS